MVPIEQKSRYVKGRLFIWLAAIPIWILLTFTNHRKFDFFVEHHFWWVILLPLAVVFLAVFVRNYYLQYKR